MSLVCSKDEALASIRNLLQRFTYWHAEVDRWLLSADILHRPTDPFAAVQRLVAMISHDSTSWQPVGALPLPTAQVVAYVITSASLQSHYTGSTKNMPRRLHQHRCQAGALGTIPAADWELAAYVGGFPNDAGGLALARMFETQWQRLPWRAYRSLPETVRIGRYLISTWDAKAAAADKERVPLFMESNV